MSAAFALHDFVRLTAAKQADWPDIGNLVGKIERVDPVTRKLTVYWIDRGAWINLGFDDVGVVA